MSLSALRPQPFWLTSPVLRVRQKFPKIYILKEGLWDF